MASDGGVMARKKRDTPLFPRKVGPPKAPDPYPGETQKLIVLYARLYRQRFGEAPDLSGRDAGTLKRLLKLAGPEKTTERLIFFMEWMDPFVMDCGFSIGVFERQWPKITSLLQRTTTPGLSRIACQHQPPCRDVAEHSRRYVEEMRQPGRTTTTASSPTPSTPKSPF